VNGGSSTANQTATNHATANAPNSSTTTQTATPKQTAGSFSCWYGCGGHGQSQNVWQKGKTNQDADADAWAKQYLLNSDVPFALSYGRQPRGKVMTY
jgi:hypothetical protein